MNKRNFLRAFVIVTILFSCSKEKTIPSQNNTTPLPQSPLSGREFLFENLTWEYYNSGAGSPSFDEVYLTTPPLNNLFQGGQIFKYGYVLESDVFVKLDTASDWVKIKSEGNIDNSLPGQFLYTIRGSVIVINIFPINLQLTGRKSSVKIKFK